MSTYLGNVKGPPGEQGIQGPQGTDSLTITVNTDAAPALGSLSHDHEYRCTNLSLTTAPTITLPAISSTSDRFMARVIYKSPGTNAPVVTNNSGYTLKYQGKNVLGGTFYPVSGIVYQISFVFDGIYMNVFISGV